MKNPIAMTNKHQVHLAHVFFIPPLSLTNRSYFKLERFGGSFPLRHQDCGLRVDTKQQQTPCVHQSENKRVKKKHFFSVVTNTLTIKCSKEITGQKIALKHYHIYSMGEQSDCQYRSCSQRLWRDKISSVLVTSEHAT